MPKDVFGKGYKFLASSALLEYAQIERLVRIFARVGVSKIRLTGGEPLLRNDLEDLVARISSLEEINDVALTTNASLLTADRADSLRQAGVKRVNISLDAMTPEIYYQINQVPYPLETVLEGVDNALDAGFEVVKVNMVVQKDINVGDILPMVEYFRHSGAILRFIEFMDVGNHNRWNLDRVFTSREIIDLIRESYALSPIGANYKGEVAKRWQFDDGAGEVGVISSISQPFCGDCARARLSAKGELFTCLFATQGKDLKALLEAGWTDQQLTDEIGGIWSDRKDQYSVLRGKTGEHGWPRTSQKVEMSYIGG